MVGYTLAEKRVLNCMFAEWYPKFRKHTLESEIIELPEEFIQFLNSDSIFVPEDAVPMPESKDRYDEGEEPWPEEEAAVQPERFPELEAKVKEVIQRFGAVLPKLNWSAPKTECIQSFEECEGSSLKRPPKFTLVLRKWYDLNQSMEFRCFVKNNVLFAISQRDHHNYYEHLKSSKDQITELIVKFFNTNVKDKFPDDTFVMDVYISKSMRVYLIDFNPWTAATESLLFEWAELNEFSTQSTAAPELRIITSQSGIRPTLSFVNSVPYDVVDFSNAAALNELIQKMQESGNIQKPGDSSSDDD